MKAVPCVWLGCRTALGVAGDMINGDRDSSSANKPEKEMAGGSMVGPLCKGKWTLEMLV